MGSLQYCNSSQADRKVMQIATGSLFSPLLLSTNSIISLPTTSLDGRSDTDSSKPFSEVWKLIKLFLRKSRPRITIHPWKRTDIRHTVLSFTFTSKIITRFSSVFATESDLENTIDSQSLIMEAFDRVCPRLASHVE